MARIIVERSFQSPITDRWIDDTGKRVGDCLDLYGVQYIRSFMSPDRRRLICEYEAGDAESVRSVQHSADVSYDRVWVAEVLGPHRDG